jgi:hypothetical protein
VFQLFEALFVLLKIIRMQVGASRKKKYVLGMPQNAETGLNEPCYMVIKTI